MPNPSRPDNSDSGQRSDLTEGAALAIEQIKAAIRARYLCDSSHLSTDWFKDIFSGIVWAGNVEIFTLQAHPKTQYCYAWHGANGDITTVLQIPPVISPRWAVRMTIESELADLRRSQ